MLKILNNSLDGIVLGQKKADFDDVILNNPNYSLEFDRKHKIQSDSELITVSSLRNCDEFCLNGKVINFSNLEKFSLSSTSEIKNIIFWLFGQCCNSKKLCLFSIHISNNIYKTPSDLFINIIIDICINNSFFPQTSSFLSWKRKSLTPRPNFDKISIRLSGQPF